MKRNLIFAALVGAAVGLASLSTPAEAFHPCRDDVGGVCGKDHFRSPYDYPSYAGPPVGSYGWAPVRGQLRWAGRGSCGGRCGGGYATGGGSAYSKEEVSRYYRTERTGTHLQFEGWVLRPLNGGRTIILPPGR